MRRRGDSSPHPRGDGPADLLLLTMLVAFSPPAWGWSDSLAASQPSSQFSPPAWGWSGSMVGHHRVQLVLPTRVGMVRLTSRPALRTWRSPHPRGDGPTVPVVEGIVSTFSPPAWGWSDGVRRDARLECVLPTRVGMVRQHRQFHWFDIRSPHPRGDGPMETGPALTRYKFSPPAWGWSGQCTNESLTNTVLPTRVGMVRWSCRTQPEPAGSPHPRGDGPNAKRERGALPAFSPPAWGWSGEPSPLVLSHIVLPTRVGMVRRSTVAAGCCAGSPHPRGDGPRPQ